MNEVDRTNAKLRYAQIHLEELKTHASRGSGDDFERAHHESFIYQLYSARDAFLQELNVYYGLGLDPSEVRARRVRDAGLTRGREVDELDQLVSLEREDGSWLNQLREMRHHSIHRRNIPRVLFSHGHETHLKDPRTGEAIEEDVVALFARWHESMTLMLAELRRSARESA